MHPTLFPGQHLVLLPSGCVGVVESIDHEDVPSFIFGHITMGTRVRVADLHRYRPVLTPDEAAAVERRLLETPAIPELLSEPLRSSASAISRRLDLYLLGTEAQRVAGFATVLDWARDAIARGETHGLWRGMLTWGQDRLLGELALVRGMTPEAYVQHLLALRMASPRRDYDVPPPSEPGGPTAELEFYPESGRHELGVIHVSHDLLVTQDTTCKSEEEVEDGGFVDARPGRWFVFMHVADDAVTPELKEAIRKRARNRDQCDAIMERLDYLPTKWLVLVHEGALGLASDPPSLVVPKEATRSGVGSIIGGLLGRGAGRREGGSADDKVAQFLAGARDIDVALNSLGRGVRAPDGTWLELEVVGVCDVEGGEIGVFAKEPSDETARAIDFHRPDGTNVWPWGIVHSLGGDASVPVYGSPRRPRDIIVIPA